MFQINWAKLEEEFRKRQQEQQNDTNSPPSRLYTGGVDSSSPYDNEITAKLRSHFTPYAQAKRGNADYAADWFRGARDDGALNGNKYMPGTVLHDAYEAGRTGKVNFQLASAASMRDRWDTWVKMGINDPYVAMAARNKAYNNVADAVEAGKEAAPLRYDSYIDRNAGKGYKAFGGNAGDVHKYGLAYENVLAAEATKINRKEGRKDDVETIKAGDYASLSDGYIDEMIAKTEEHVAQLMAQEKLYVMNPSAVDHQAIKGELMTAQTVLASLQQEKQDRSAMAAYVEEYAQGSNAPDWGSMVDVDEKGTDIVDKMLYMNLVSQQRGNWDDDDNEWYRSIGAEMGGSIPSYNDYSSEGYHLMTADEITLVNKVWNTTHDPIKTQEVLDAMASTLRSRRMNFDENLWAYRADAYGDLVLDLASIPMQTYADFEGAVNAFQGVLGNEDVKDITSGEWRTQNSVNAIRGWTGDKAYNSGGWLGKIAHDWGLAAGDEMMRFLPSLVFGPGAQKLMSRIAGMNQGAYGAYGRGVDNSWQGLLEGAAFGQIEAMTENLGLDVPSTSATRPSKHLFKQIAAEAGEEMASEALGQITGEAIADWTGTTSANDQAYMDALMASDEKDRLKRHQEAQEAVAGQNLQDIGYSGLMGGLVGATLSGPSAMSLGRHQRRTGKMISSNNNANALLNVGMSMDEGSEARQMAEAFSAQAKKGKKMSNGQLGRLYAATAKDLDAQSAAVVTETMNDVIAEEMVNKGASEETAKAAAPILSKQLRGEELTEADRRVLRQSKAATTMLEELNRITEGGKDGEAVAVEWADKAVGDAMAKGQSLAEKGIQLGSTLRPTASTAIAKSAKKAKTLTSETATETGVRNTAATPLGSKEAVDIQRVEADKNGVLKLHVKAADGTEKNISYQQLSFQSESTGHVITHAIDNAGGNAELANLMVQGYTGGDSTEYLAQFDAAYRAGYDGTALNADNMTRFGKGIGKEAFKLGQKQAQEAEQTRLKNIGKGMTGNGSVAIPDGVDVNRLSKPQRRQVAVVRTIAKATGINFTFYQSVADDSGVYRAENGSYDAATNRIRLDLNAGKNYRGDVAEYAILRTAAHEMTHFIEANSRENYAKMRQYIADEFARKGIDFNVRVQEKIDASIRLVEEGRLKTPLTRGGAIAEVVADGCEMMLQDSQAVQRLLQKDESLAGQIKQVLSDFADRIRKAFDGIRPGSKDAEALLEEHDGLLHYADELVKLWDEGLVEAVENVQNTETSTAGIPHVQQFELRSIVEQRNDGLIAVHNISSNKLMDTLELGAFPMPSIAVVKAKQGHDSFGEYSVVFAPDTIDPKKNKANRVYGNDAWTPVFPQVEREINSKELHRAADEVESAAGKIAEAYERDARSFFNRFAYQDETYHSDGDIQEYAWNNDGMVAAYASENGTAVEILQHDVPVNRGYNIARADQYDKILDIISAEDIGRLSGKDIFNTYGDQLAEVGRTFFNAVEAWKMGDLREAVRGLEIIKQAKAYEDAGRDAKPLTRREDDYAGTARAVRDSIDRASFNDWVMEKMSRILGQKGIRNDKDRFTPSGSRRSFKALHDAYTAENVVRAMLRQDESSISSSDARGLKAAASSMYSSLDDIRADAERLRQVSEAEYDAILAKADNELRDFFNAIEAWDYDMQEEAGNLLVKAAKRNMVPAQMAKLFRQNGFSKATEENAEIGRKVLDQLQKIPTGYFEAKPARVVSFDEVRMVVAPDTMPVKLADALNERGIPYTTYDGTSSDRKAKLNAVDGVQFSPRNSNDPEVASIKDQIRQAQAELNSMAPVASVMAPDMTGWNKKKQKTWILDKLKYTGYKVDVIDFGVIEFGANQIDMSLEYLNTDAEVSAFLAVPRVLKRGKLIARHEDHKVRGFGTVTFAAPVEINGKRGNMAIVVKRLGRNLYKTHRILMPDGSAFTFIDNKKAEPTPAGGIPSNSMAQAQRISSTGDSITRGDEFVNKNSQKSLRTPEFNRWFGNSQVVDENGNPLVVYHTTPADFTIFDKAKLGKITDTNADPYLVPTAHTGFWFNTQPLGKEGFGTNEMAVYLSAKRMYEAGSVEGLAEEIWDYFGQFEYNEYEGEPNDAQAAEAGEFFANYLQSRGYDGIMLQDEEFGGTSYVVFEPTQIKSATDNAGTFDPQNPDIRYSLRTPAPATTRDYLLSLPDTDLTTEGQKDAMRRYKAYVDELRGLEEQRATQEELAQTTTGDAQLAAKARAGNLTKQVDRLRDKLHGMENSNVFRPLAAEARAVLEANRQLDVGRPMEEVVRQLDHRLQESLSRTEQNLVALDKQLREATAKVDKLNKNATAASAKAMFDSKDINQRISSIKQLHGNAMSSAELSNRLALMYATYWSDLDGNGPSLAMNMAQELARDIVSRSKSHTQSWVLGAIRENLGAFSLNEKQLQELNHAGYNINSMRSALSGVAKYSATASSLDSKWEELCAAVPSLDPAASEGDQITSLIDLISREKQTEQGFDHAPAERVEAELLVSLLDMPTPQKAKAAGISNINAIKAAVTDSASILQELEDSAAKASNSLKNAKSANLSAGRIADEAQKAVEYYKALYERQVAKTGSTARQAEEKLIRFRQQVQEDRNTREKITATRRRITKMVKYLDTLRRKESDYKHVPEELKPTVNALVAAFAEHSSMVFDSRRAERIAQAYSKLQALDNDLAAFYDPDIQEKIEYIAALMELKRGKPMKLAEVEIIEDVVGSIYTMVRGSNDAFIDDQKADFEHIAQNVADEMLARQDKTYRVGSKLEDGLNTLIVSGNLTPVYYFDNLGNAMLKRLGYDIMNGQDKYGLYQRDDRNTMGEIRRKYHYNDWKNDKPIVHNDVQFTKEQVLWVYATAKREATNELAQTHHLDEGGIVFEGGEVVGAYGKKRKVTTPMRLSAKDVQAITSTLTEEQKGYADAVVRHMSTTVGDRGNEVSMRMYGFRKYREQYYFPYKTAGDQRHQTSVSNAVSATNDARLKHQSFSNPLKKGANTPLVIGDFTEMATSHMNAMNTYAAMVIPVENMNRVLNRKTDVNGATTTIRALMAQKYGDPTKAYLETLLKDLNGGVQVDRREGFTGALTSIYKGGAVVGSMSVVLQQWTSIFRAAYMINPKYFVSQSPFFKDEWDELTKYSGIASIKDMGRFDVGIGRTGAEWVGADADDFTVWQKARQMFDLRDRETLTTRWDDFFNFLPGWADRVTWAQIWRAVKAEQADQHPGMDTGSEAFKRLCAERFNDVINHTQVYDSVMSRSQLMRGKDAASKMVTAFASEPTLMINMLYDAAHNPEHKGFKARIMHIGGAMTTVMLCQVFAAAMQALASAWRDDDDERKGLDKFLDRFGENVFDNLNPFSMFPMVRDIYTTLKGEYDVERGDMEFISEMARMLKKLEKGGMTPWQYVEEVGGTVAKIFRIPLKNIMRDMRAAYNAVNSDWTAPSASTASHSFWRNRWGYDTSNAAYYQRLVDAINSGDKKLASDLRLYLTESMLKDEDAISTGARSYIKDLVQAGTMGLDDAVKLINTHFPYDKGEKYAYKTVLGWLDEIGLGEGEQANTSAYRKLQEAMTAGSNADYAAAVKELQKYGYEEKSIKAATKDFIKDSYKAGTIQWAQAEKMLKQFYGMTDANDLYWQKDEWDYAGDDTYGEYNKFRNALLAGDKKTFLSEKSRLLNHGKKGQGVSNAIGALKDELLALYENDPVEARKLREMIVWAYMECGKTKQSANKIIDGWFDDK